MILTDIAIHPVKSTAIRPVPSARVEAWGLAGDRRWMVVDGDGVLVSAREAHGLFAITADVTPGGLLLSVAGDDRLEVAEPTTAHRPVRLHRHELMARPAAAEASAWVRRVLHRDDLTLVWCDDPTRRPLNPAYAEQGDHTAFADGYPVTLVSQTSHRLLHDWMVQTALERGEAAPGPLPIQRFRPNLVVAGADLPFEEDDWSRLRIGEATFRVVKLIDRCVMTTISTDDLTTGKEPIRTLARHRAWDGTTWFGVQLVPETLGEIRAGDEVEVLMRRS